MYIILIFLLTWVALWEEHLFFYEVTNLSCFLPSEYKTHNIRGQLSQYGWKETIPYMF